MCECTIAILDCVQKYRKIQWSAEGAGVQTSEYYHDNSDH